MQASVKRWRWLGLLAIYLALLVGGSLVGHQLFEVAAIEIRPLNEPMVHAMIMSATVIFILASATPFVPGAEIGFALLLVFGAKIALLVYVAMVAALLLAYLVGRLVPVTAIGAAFAYCGLTRAHRLALQMRPLDANARLALLAALAPPRFVPFLLRNRHLALVVLLNLPGNSVVGGGGGIALCAGMSGLFPPPGYLAAVLLAVAPVPLFFWLGLNAV
jgi:hypothetical protein